jgi:hypothetical protein
MRQRSHTFLTELEVLLDLLSYFDGAIRGNKDFLSSPSNSVVFEGATYEYRV